MNPATLIFLLTYVLVALGENSPRKLDRPTATLLGAVLMVATGALTRAEARAAIDISTLAVLFGLMLLLIILLQSGFPTWLAFKALGRCRGPRTLLALVVFSSGLTSALMLNDTVCLIGTPLLLEMTAQVGLPATPYLLALATSANIGSVMTLTGNPQNIIIGQASGWSWAGFAFRMAPVGLICLAANWLLLSLLFHRHLAGVRFTESPYAPPDLKVDSRLAIKSVLVFVGLIIAFLWGQPMDFAAVAAGTLLLVWSNRSPREALVKVDWTLLLFFAGLFVVVQGFLKADTSMLLRLEGLAKPLSDHLGWRNIGLLSTAVVAGSNLFSNVPLVLLVSHWIENMAHPQFLWLLLALTSTLAGNLTLFGSVANVIVAQGAQSRSPLKFSDFLWVGLPITLVTTALGVLILWVFFRWGWI
uniref:Anion transporter n=1 Tax=Desulfobacca acetoxidans TaxID=60893 RepID=A0A7C3SIA0_9BACT